LVIAKYGLTTFDVNGRKMHRSLVQGLVEGFLLKSDKVHPRCKFGFLDHCGHDAEGNLISEAYIRDCKACQGDAATFAAKLGLRYELSALTYHAPELKRLMRMTFFHR
jgi:hypothetical protein